MVSQSRSVLHPELDQIAKITKNEKRKKSKPRNGIEPVPYKPDDKPKVTQMESVVKEFYHYNSDAAQSSQNTKRYDQVMPSDHMMKELSSVLNQLIENGYGRYSIDEIISIKGGAFNGNDLTAIKEWLIDNGYSIDTPISSLEFDKKIKESKFRRIINDHFYEEVNPDIEKKYSDLIRKRREARGDIEQTEGS